MKAGPGVCPMLMPVYCLFHIFGLEKADSLPKIAALIGNETGVFIAMGVRIISDMTTLLEVTMPFKIGSTCD